MAEILLRGDFLPDDCAWVEHEQRPEPWGVRTHKVDIEEWYVEPPQLQQETPSEEVEELLGEVQELSDQLLQVIKNLDVVLVQMKANQEAIDQGKVEISRIKRELNLG